MAATSSQVEAVMKVLGCMREAMRGPEGIEFMCTKHWDGYPEWTDRGCPAAVGAADDWHGQAGLAAEGAGQRLVIRVNQDAGMSRGKYAAQAVHAALILLGVHPGCPVIVLGAKKRDILKGDVVVRDAGWTEVEPGTVTATASWEQPL